MVLNDWVTLTKVTPCWSNTSPAYWNSKHPQASTTRKHVTDWFEQRYGSTYTISPSYFVDRTKLGKILFLGEGNLSFALSIAILSDAIPSNIFATTYEEEKNILFETKKNAELLKKIHAIVKFGVDATKLAEYDGTKFKTIIFQFPHTGSREPVYGHNPNFVLIRRFLKIAKDYLESNGQIVISTVDSSHYRGAFQFEEAAKETGYNKPKIFNFNPDDFAGYNHINTNDDESALNKHKKFSTWIFTQKSG